MIAYQLDERRRVLRVHPQVSVQKGDFEELARIVDPFIEKTGGLNGLVIEARDFQGWEDFSAMIEHFRFIRNHHRQVARVALVTDSRLAEIVERIGSHFVSAQVRRFPAGQATVAEAWAEGTGQDGSQEENKPGQ